MDEEHLPADLLRKREQYALGIRKSARELIFSARRKILSNPLDGEGATNKHTKSSFSILDPKYTSQIS